MADDVVPELRRWLAAAGRELDDAVLERTLRSLSPGERMVLGEHWPLWAHGGQEEPPASAGAGLGDWRVWVIQAGRGFGKTRAGAEWVWARAREQADARIALVGATLDEATAVMVHGESGIFACARADETPRWISSRRMLVFPSGARAFAFSGEKPDKLRGPQHHFAWCDELAKWRLAQATWDNLMLGLRLGDKPRAVVTTTPRAGSALKAIAALARTAVTRGRTSDNRHLGEDYRDAMMRTYAGTRLGRQELDGEQIDDVEGALWTREMIEGCLSTAHLDFARCSARDERSFFRRVVVGVDPPAGDGGTCGIVVCGLDADERAYVLADLSVARASPQGWAGKVAAAAEAWGAHRVVAEANNGGKMVETVLRGASVTLPLRLVHASEGKAARAEPVAALFESKQAFFAGRFPELEDQLCGLVAGGGHGGPGRSPDRADAMVWALTELKLGKRGRAPSVMQL